MVLVLVPGLGQLSKDQENFLAKYGQGWTVYSLARGNGTPGRRVATPPLGSGNGRRRDQRLPRPVKEGRSRPCHAARPVTRSPAWGYAHNQLDIMAITRSRGLGARPEAELGPIGQHQERPSALFGMPAHSQRPSSTRDEPTPPRRPETQPRSGAATAMAQADLRDLGAGPS